VLYRGVPRTALPIHVLQTLAVECTVFVKS